MSNPSKPNEKGRGPMQDNSSYRILVVDDDSSLTGVLKELLTDNGYQVETAGKGEQALEMMRQAEFHIVLTDIRMEGMSGLDLIRHVRRTQPESEVIIMTSYASIESAVEALRLGAYDYLVKPFDDLNHVLDLVKRTTTKVKFAVENRKLMEDLQRKNQELAKLNETIRELAVRDGLTGLYNYRYFQEMLQSETARSQRHHRKLCLLMIDVDHFKVYNDLQGHPMGDEVLKGIARILMERARRTDLVARYGGEELVVVLPETPRENARKVAEDFRRRVENFSFPKGENQPIGRITISIGLAEFPADAADARALIERADKALYAAKSGGRNRVVGSEALGREGT